MIPDNVTLIVKAPNQQIEDQNVECESSWTVRQLKGHLSEVYPSKPRTDEQKIIYSGQLLDDNTILKDVLRTYESQIAAHTMHLVCTPTRKMPEPQPTPLPSTDGLRQRNVPTAPPQPTVTEPTRPETRQNDQNHNVEMANYLNSLAHNYGRVPPYPPALGALPVPGDPALLATHMAMMQQAYLQYMHHVHNMWQATATGVPPQPAPATEPPPAPPAPAPPADDDDAHAHDWLDQLYAASRLAILFSLVYLYGSPARLLLVALLAAAGYLHQIGFFRDLHLNPAPAAAAAPAAGAAPAAAADAAGEAQPVEHPANQANANPENNNQPDAPAPLPDTQQSLLAVTWMIFTSFFASLIPEAN